MASFLDRVRCASDWDTDGGYIEPTEVSSWINLYASGTMTAAQIKSYYSMTTAQATQLDAILATRPVSPLLLLNVPAYVQWTDKIVGILRGAAFFWPQLDTDAEVKAALGI